MDESADNDEWISCTANTGIRENQYNITGLKSSNQYRIRVAAKNLAGSGKPVELSAPVQPKDVLVPPEIEVDSDTGRMISVKAGGTIRLLCGISGRPTPSAKWTKDSEINKMAQVETTSSSSSMLIDNCSREDAGKYTLTLENTSGSKSVSINVKVMDTPGPVKDLNVVEVTREYAVIKWEPPELDGGSAISNYVIGKRETARKSYQAAGSTPHRTSFKVTGLTEGDSYFFRVAPENEYGVGAPCETLQAVKISEVPSLPEKIVIEKVTDDSVALAWSKPEYNGGSPVCAYIVEHKKHGEGSAWVVGGTTKSNKLTVGKLMTGKDYVFRVRAQNEVGLSDGQETNIVNVREIMIAPDLDTRKFHNNTVAEKAGMNLELDIPYAGRPTPSIRFMRDGEPLKQTSRINSEAEANVAKLNIKSLTRKDAGDYELIAENLVGTKKAVMHVVVMEKPSQPQGPVNICDVSAESVTIAWEAPLEDGGTPVTHYTVEKLDSVLGWMEVSGFVVRTTQKITRLTTGQEYVFRIRAANKFGLSEPLDSEPVMARHPFEKPGTVIQPNITSVSNDAIVVAWQEPVSDGGSPIIGYHIQRKDRNSILWEKANSYAVKDTTFKCSNLQPGLSYEFRVAAENLAGMGKFSNPSEAEITRDPIEPPRNVHATKINRTNITLQWKRPEYDGGSKITGYVVEKLELPLGRWVKCNFNKVRDTSFEVDGLQEESSYEFRVLAQNAAGSISKPSASTGSITARDHVEPASVDVDSEFRGVVNVKAGDTFTLKAFVSGKPTPTVTWDKDGKEFESGSKRNIKTTDETSNVTIKEASRLDSGIYTIKVHNAAGERTIGINVRVQDTPGPCQDVVVKDVTSEKCKLSWNPPQLDGGSKITGYCIEKREVSRLAWTIVTSSTESTQHKVTGLLIANEYIFRIRAENKFGRGEATESEPVVAVDPFTSPGAPGKPGISNILNNSCTLSWNRPDSDGGAEIMGYIVERREKNSSRWHRVNQRLVSDPRLRVTDLKEESNQEFRVYAENRAGIGTPSDSSGIIHLSDPSYPPDKPGIPQVMDSSKSSVTLHWSRPMYDGGSHIIGYSVDYRELSRAEAELENAPDDVDWTNAIGSKQLRTNTYTITGLSQSKFYQFRVKAHNEIGASKPSLTAKISPVERYELPTFGVNSDLRKSLTLKAGGTLRLAVPIGGRPPPKVTWSRPTNQLKDRAIIDTSDTMTTLLVEDLTREDSAKYTLTLENQSGNAAASVLVKVLDTPGPPEAVTITGTSKSTATLSWKAPENDGGSVITNYILERREATRKSWTSVETSCTRMSYRFSNLDEGKLYFFRISAENEFGVGPGTQTDKPTKASEEPGSPSAVQCKEITKNSVTLHWYKPDYDGGSELIDYTIEYKMKGFDQWSKAKTVKANVHDYTVTNLNENQQYAFRVSANNERGAGQPTETLGYVLVKSQTSPPHVELGGLAQKTIEGKAGTNLKGSIPIKGRPFPNLRWKLEDEELKMTSRINTSLDGNVATLNIKDANLSDAGRYELILDNSSGSKVVPVVVRVLDKPGPPSGPVEFSNVTSDSLTLSWSSPEADGGAPINNYIVDMREASGDATEWRMISGTTTRTSIKVSRLKTGMDYAFRIRAENRFGIGKALESSAVKAQFPFKVPGPPGQPQVASASRESMTIKWERPLNDGGNKVMGYHVEKKDRNALMWTKCNRSLVSNTEFKVTNLTDGLEYEFRIYAENEAGIGRASKSSDATFARDSVDAPRSIDVVGVTRDSVHLQWMKPEYDGGARITGYIIERMDYPGGRWLKCNFSNVIATDYDVESLTEGNKYYFRVFAKNAAGSISLPVTTIEPVLVKHELTSPVIYMDASYAGVVTVTAGKNIKLEAGVRGKPDPELTWSKDESIIKESIRIIISNTNLTSYLLIQDACRDDTGTYALTAENLAGSTTTSVQVKVLDKPGKPEGPIQITPKSSDTCTISWKPPHEDGGAKVTNYVVEKREATHLAWILVNSHVEGLSCKVTRLLPGNEYIFRVRAENKYGVGLTLESSEYVSESPFGKPSAPALVEVSSTNKNSALLTWSRPTNDGGSEICGYFIEKRQLSGLRWISVNRQPILETRHRVPNLNEGQTYEFRVRAENVAGNGSWSDPTASTLIQEQKYPPEVPLNLTVVDTTKSSVILSWSNPNFDGGSQVIGYVVEMSTESTRLSSSEEDEDLTQTDSQSQDWLRASGSSLIRDMTHMIAGLREKTKYRFRVAAANKLGTGEWAYLKNTVQCIERREVPALVLDDTVQRNAIVKAGKTIRLNLGFRGRPTPTVSWSKADTSTEVMKKRAMIDTTSYTTSLTISDASRDDAGKYMVVIENSEGSKDFIYSVKVLDTPGPVIDLRIAEVTNDSVLLKWVEPENDGGAYISNYVVQKRGWSRKAFATVTSECTRNSFKVTSLNEGDDYMFRVIAENAHGLGIPAETAKPVTISTKPSSPDKLTVTDITKSSVSLAWSKPDHNGGSEITAYVVEMVLSGFENWQQCASVNSLSAKVKSLEEGRTYVFRVKAKNEVGFSDATVLHTPITVKDVVEKPSISSVDLPTGTINRKAGSSLDVCIPIGGKPKADVTWKKDGQSLKETTRTSTARSNIDTKLTFKSLLSEDSGRYEVIASNCAGTASAFIHINVLDKPGKIVNLVTESVTENSISLAWTPPVKDGGCQISNYFVQMRDTETETWIDCSAVAVRPRIKIGKLTLGKEYQFRIAAVNRFGDGEFVVSEKITVKYPFNKPGPPGMPIVSSVGSEHVVLRWEKPVQDGGSPVVCYHVEMKDRNSILWCKVNRMDIHDTNYKVANLQTGLTYEFRVYAENAAGCGKPSQASDLVVARIQISPPNAIEVTGFTRNTVDLMWKRPENDGGARITGYVVESRQIPHGRWIKCNFSNLSDCQYTATSLLEDMTYEFQVIAKNAAGSVSAPSMPSEQVTCKDSFTPPRIDLAGNMTETTVLKAGETIRLATSIFGKPKPTITWSCNNVELENTSQTEIVTTNNTTSLCIKDSNRSNTGEYLLQAVNTAGSRSIVLNVKVLDCPGQPIGPLAVSEITAERCRLTWRPPGNNGGAPITHYVVEKRETSRLAWTLAQSNVEGVTTKVPRLLKGNEYIFRVMAVNKYGVGLSLESLPVVAKDPFNVPGQTGRPQVSTVMKDSAVITWTRPSDDGGNEVTNYHIDKKERNSLRWIRAVRRPVTGLHYKITGLNEGSEYEFRVAAENAAGIGPVSEPSALVLCKEPTYVPGPIGMPQVADTTKSSVSLAWTPPSFDGGSDITGYQVEINSNDAVSENWIRCSPSVGVKTTEYTVTSLQPNKEYKFRIAAINVCGVGETVNLPSAVETVERFEAPEIPASSDFRKNLIIKAGNSARLFVPIRGKPTPSITWRKDGVSKLSEKTQIDSSDSSTLLIVPECTREDAGKYTLTLENSSGTVTASCFVKVLDTPGKCENLQVRDVSRSQAILAWNPPLNDGGSFVYNYVVEKKEVGHKAWSTITTSCQRGHFKANLIEGHSYLFRVMAENENGIGEPVETAAPIKAMEVPGTPDKLDIIDVTRSSVSLQWNKPDETGGSPIFAYIIESLEKDQNKWMKRATVKDLKTTISNLKEGQEYAFRVTALNEAGASDTREASSLVLVRDTLISPLIDISSLPHSVAHARAGTDLTIEIPYSGKPIPNIKWTRNNIKLRSTKRIDANYEKQGIASLKIKDITLEDEGDYELVAENKVGSRSASIKIIVLDKPGPIENLKFSDVSESSVVLLWDPPTALGGCAVSCYAVDCRSTEESEWKMVSSSVVRTTFKASKLIVNKEYVFRVRAMNKFGLGPATITDRILTQLPYKVPGPPTACSVKDVTKEAMTVHWQEPVNDGGNPVVGYHMEMKERNSILWKKVNRSIIRSTHYRVPNLQEGLEYEFRVSAENNAGIGKPSKPSECALARDPVDSPVDVEVADITRSTCLLRWKKPEYDGGQRIVGYLVEKKDYPVGRWIRASFNMIPENEFLVTGLTGGSQYEFRIIAKNAAGILSEPSASTGVVKCDDDFKLPRVDLDAHLLDEVRISAGSTLRLHAGIVGKPTPAVMWLLNEKLIKDSLRHQFDNTTGHSSIIIKDCERRDSGIYTIQASNACGEKSAQIKVQVLDKPGPPTGPLQFSRVTESHITCSWSAPKENGGSKITHYVISKRETSRLTWSIVSEAEELSTHTVHRLLKNNEYQFRVQAVNKFGVGEPLVSDPIIAKNSFTVPSAPFMPDVSKVTSNSCVVTWSRPESDGGADIDSYVVERRDTRSARWIKCNKKPIRDLRFKVTNIGESNEYEFRVAAENAAGTGQYSQPSLPVVARDPIDAPGPPGNPMVRDTTNNSVTLSWSRPAYDGGSVVTCYIVDMKQVEKDSEIEEEDLDQQGWNTVSTNVIDSRHVVKSLNSDNFYRFRISAVNKGGVGDSAYIVGSVKPEDRIEPPEYDLPSSLRKTVLVKAGNTVKFEVPFAGRPRPNIRWTKNDVNVVNNRRAQVDTVDGKTILVLQDCSRSDTGKYVLKLENSSGVATTFISIKVLDTPGPPGAIRIKEVTQDYVFISWDSPQIDGGSDVFNYQIDKRETTHRAWSSVTHECSKLSWKISDLHKGGKYFFRVTAENEYGLGVPVESEAVTVAQISSPVCQLKADEITKNTVKLSWNKPNFDGGAMISNYHIDYKRPKDENWSTMKTKQLKAIIDDVVPGDTYEIKVSVENEAGLSESTMIGPLVVRDQLIPPEADLSSIPGKVVNLREGGNLRLDIPFFGKPLPTIKWTKDRIPLKQTENIAFEKIGDLAVLMIKGVKKSQAGQYHLNLESAAGRKDFGFTLNVFGSPGKVKGPIEFSDVTANSIVVKWLAPDDNGGSDITNYIVEKKETSNDFWTPVNANCSRTTLKATKLHEKSEYVFRIAAENKYGIGEFVESSEIIAKYPFRIPSQPPQPEVIEISADSMTVSWNECYSDGGTEITGYYIERKERNAILWTKLNVAALKNREFKTSGLIEGLEYQFRVYAENMVGVSHPSEPSKFERAHNIVSPPSSPDWTDITRDSVALKWNPPKNNGGSKIIGYNVEKRSGSDGRWFKCNYTNVSECEFTVSSLTAGEKYQFRVFARNASGTVSKPSLPSVEVVCHDDFKPPSIHLASDILDGVSIRAGATLKLKAMISGKPNPVIIWTQNGKEVVVNQQVDVENTNQYSLLVIKDTDRLNSGQYTITAKNVCATKTMDIKVVVLDRPAPPDGPVRFSALTNEKVTLWWGVPTENGGATIESYVVEKRETTRLNWALVTASCEATNHTVTKLIKNHEYQFRISAQNKYGVGDALLSEPVTAKVSYDVPSAPGRPQYTSSTCDSITIAFTRPISDGGNDIIGYNVERREKRSMRWIRVSKNLITDLRCRASGLGEGNEYEFRVFAENQAGQSKPSETSALIVCREPISPPGQPGTARIMNTTRTTVEVSWTPPTFDGGSPIAGYIVEVKKFTEDEPEEWIRMNPEIIRSCDYIIPNLDPDSFYFVRVKAISAGGVGDAVTVSGKVLTTEKSEAPDFQIDADFKSHYVVKAGCSLRLFVLYRGRPRPSVTWSKPDTDLEERANIQVNDSNTLLVIDSTTRNDSGKYSVTLENSAGEKKLHMTVRILDSPGPVSPIVVKEVTSNYITLSWEAPEIDGGAFVKNYVIEKREVSRRSWQTVTVKCSRTSFRVTGLKEGVSYLFRVTPENEYGIGVPRETEISVAATEVPSIPNRLDVDKVRCYYVQQVFNTLIFFSYTVK